MQVGLKTTAKTVLTPSSASAARGLARAERAKTTAVSQPQTEKIQEFPDHPLISTRPVRYNVQLNDQITAVQQADSYLRHTETLLLRMRQSNGAVGSSKNRAQSAATLEQLLDRRQQLSGNTIDQQLNVSLEGRSEVRFSVKEGQALLQSEKSETLLFSLAGERRELVAVRLGANSSPQHIVRQLNQGLGRWGIHGTLDERQQLTFSVSEQQWERVSSQSSVSGEGYRYPSGQFNPVLVQKETGMVDELREVARQPQQTRIQGKELARALEQVTQQRHLLARSREQVEQRLNTMNTYKESAAAEAASRQLANKLQSASGDYGALSQALGAQANLRAFIVKNVLA
ncbi:MAG: hypothetical protein ACRC5A_03830 [Enterobacteriaceae bacterium]